jgi:hypothetical protein
VLTRPANRRHVLAGSRPAAARAATVLRIRDRAHRRAAADEVDQA